MSQLRELLEQAVPSGAPVTDVDVVRRVDRRKRRRHRGALSAGTLALVCAVGAAVMTSRTTSGVRVQTNGVAGAGTFSDRTDTTLVFDDGYRGVVSVDLDRRVAVRHPVPGIAAADSETGLVAAGSSLIVGAPDVFVVPADGSAPLSLGHATIALRAAEPDRAWLLEYPGPTLGSGAPTVREVDSRGTVVSGPTTVTPRGAPDVGFSDGIVFESDKGLQLWNAATGGVSVVGSAGAIAADSRGDQMAWCEADCSSLHIRNASGTDFSIPAPNDASTFDPRSARFSPDGRLVAAVATEPGVVDGRSRGELVLIDVNARTSRVVSQRALAYPVSLTWSSNGSRVFVLPSPTTKTSTALGEYTVSAGSLEIATLPFPVGHLGVAARTEDVRGFLSGNIGDESQCPPPTADADTTTVCAFAF